MPSEQQIDLGGGLPSTSRSLPFALLRAREKVMAPIRGMLADLGITEQQWRILRVLAEYGTLDSTKLSEHACLLMQSQTRIVQSLQEMGYVTRERAETDRRRQLIAITDKGRRIIEKRYEQAVAIAQDFKAMLGARKHELLLDLLDELSAQ